MITFSADHTDTPAQELSLKEALQQFVLLMTDQAYRLVGYRADGPTLRVLKRPSLFYTYSGDSEAMRLLVQIARYYCDKVPAAAGFLDPEERAVFEEDTTPLHQGLVRGQRVSVLRTSLMGWAGDDQVMLAALYHLELDSLATLACAAHSGTTREELLAKAKSVRFGPLT